ncbi:hypothetical protein [Phytohabitans suffuscus]|uniref:Protein kinase domain-containing protein n=1 Tax=Phytohabitans suffuscus TaxID=624315 RepID=A0A6F8YF80_9ACTN|nr:hypothetical protein [Phytohabitans suffuscus]BCB84727.1 hypothetical protein Psuf_020400 [Phytohabitans suffuscus]
MADAPTVDEARLEPVDPGGVARLSGGNATLHWRRLDGWTWLYKRFTDEHRGGVDEAALTRLIAWRLALPEGARRRLDLLAAWPRFAVQAQGRTTGVLIPAAAEPFFDRRADGRRTPRVLGEMAGGAGSGGAVPPETLTVLGRLILAVRFLHSLDVVVNDVQPDNVLFRVDGQGTGVYLVDCDSMASVHWGRVGPMTAPDLMSEQVPAGAEPAVSTDLTKLFWVVARVLLDEPTVIGLGRPQRTQLLEMLPAAARPPFGALLDDPADAASWDRLGEQWALVRPFMPAAPGPPLPPPAVPVQHLPTQPRGWLPAWYSYQPDPGPPVLPPRLRGDRVARVGRRLASLIFTRSGTLAGVTAAALTVL